jgi:hypothetical protein
VSQRINSKNTDGTKTFEGREEAHPVFARFDRFVPSC